MTIVHTAIVGMRYLTLPKAFLDTAAISQTIFVRDPSNAHDANAVKCVLNGVHFGFIQKEKAAQISDAVRLSRNYSLWETGRTANTIYIKIRFSSEAIIDKTEKKRATNHDAREKTDLVHTARKTTPREPAPLSTEHIRKTNSKRQQTTSIHKTQTTKNPRKTEKEITQPKVASSKLDKNSRNSTTSQESSVKSLLLIVGGLLFLFFALSALEQTEKRKLTEPSSVNQPPKRSNNVTLEREIPTHKIEVVPTETPNSNLPGVPLFGLPANARLIDGGTNWNCSDGYRKVVDHCQLISP